MDKKIEGAVEVVEAFLREKGYAPGLSVREPPFDFQAARMYRDGVFDAEQEAVFLKKLAAYRSWRLGFAELCSGRGPGDQWSSEDWIVAAVFIVIGLVAAIGTMAIIVLVN